MTNNQYAMFVKYLAEGDMPFELVSTKEVISGQLKKLIDVASAGGKQAADCMKALYAQYGVASWEKLCVFMKNLFAQNEGILAKVGPAITRAIAWAKSVITPMAAKSVNLAKAGLKSMSLHSWYFIGLAAFALAAVIFKVATSFEKAGNIAAAKFNAAENSRAAYTAYLNKSIDRVVLESKAMFSDLTQFTESMQVSEGPLDGIASGISSKFTKMVDGLVSKMQPKVMEMWKHVSAYAKTNKVLGIAIAVCAACAFSFIGFRKYMASRKQSSALEKTIEAVIAKKAKKGSSAGKKLATKPKAVKAVKAKSNIKAAAKKMASKKK